MCRQGSNALLYSPRINTLNQIDEDSIENITDRIAQHHKPCVGRTRPNSSSVSRFD